MAVDVFPGGGGGEGEVVGCDADYGAVFVVEGFISKAGVAADEQAHVECLEELVGVAGGGEDV